MIFTEISYGRLRGACGFLAWTIAVFAASIAVWQVASVTWLFWQSTTYVPDTSLYWAVGRGILNGLVPYRDLYENKPPGIFLLSAASWGMIQSGMLGNIFGGSILAFYPPFAAWIAFRYRPSGIRHSVAPAVIAFLMGAFWTLFQARLGGPWQTENFGAFFAVLYAATLFCVRKPSWRITIVESALLLAAIGFKEPFVISCFAAAIARDARPKFLAIRFFLPLLIAAVVGGLVMWALGWLEPYFSYYLPAQFGFRGAPFGPLWQRGLALLRVLRAVASVSPLAPYALSGVLVMLSVLSIRRLRNSSTPTMLRSIAAAAAAVYLGILSIGLAGDFQAHHFVFIAPLYFMFVFTLVMALRDAGAFESTATIMSLFCASMLLLGIRPLSLPRLNDAEERHLRIVSEGIDTILSRCGVERYLYVTHEGIAAFGLTKHSPLNHSLFFQIDNAIQYGQRFLDESIARLSKSQIIIVPPKGFTPSNAIGQVMGAYVQQAFTLEPWPCAAPLPDMDGYFVLFRKEDIPLDLQIQVKDER